MIQREGRGRSWGQRAAIALAVSAVAAGCGGASRLATSTPSTATTSSNYRAAQAETRLLLSLAKVPPGARTASSPGTRQLDGVFNGTLPGATDGRRYWRIHGAYQTVITWLDAHAPAGSHPSSATSTSNGKVVSIVGGYVFFPPSTAAWDDAQLSLEATAIAPDVTAVRADAQVQWTDPTPYPDRPKGRRVHLLPAGPCPATAMPYADISNSGPGLRSSLLPQGRVTAALVCRYGQPSPSAHPNLRLTLTRRLASRAASYLAARARRVPVGHPTSQPPAGCGAFADPMRVIIAFQYAGGRTVDLWVEATACPGYEDNGSITVVDDGTLETALQRTIPGIAKKS